MNLHKLILLTEDTASDNRDQECVSNVNAHDARASAPILVTSCDMEHRSDHALKTDQHHAVHATRISSSGTFYDESPTGVDDLFFFQDKSRDTTEEHMNTSLLNTSNVELELVDNGNKESNLKVTEHSRMGTAMEVLHPLNTKEETSHTLSSSDVDELKESQHSIDQMVDAADDAIKNRERELELEKVCTQLISTLEKLDKATTQLLSTKRRNKELKSELSTIKLGHKLELEEVRYQLDSATSELKNAANEVIKLQFQKEGLAKRLETQIELGKKQLCRLKEEHEAQMSQMEIDKGTLESERLRFKVSEEAFAMRLQSEQDRNKLAKQDATSAQATVASLTKKLEDQQHALEEEQKSLKKEKESSALRLEAEQEHTRLAQQNAVSAWKTLSDLKKKMEAQEREWETKRLRAKEAYESLILILESERECTKLAEGDAASVRAELSALKERMKDQQQEFEGERQLAKEAQNDLTKRLESQIEIGERQLCRVREEHEAQMSRIKLENETDLKAERLRFKAAEEASTKRRLQAEEERTKLAQLDVISARAELSILMERIEVQQQRLEGERVRVMEEQERAKFAKEDAASAWTFARRVQSALISKAAKEAATFALEGKLSPATTAGAVEGESVREMVTSPCVSVSNVNYAGSMWGLAAWHWHLLLANHDIILNW